MKAAEVILAFLPRARPAPGGARVIGFFMILRTCGRRAALAPGPAATSHASGGAVGGWIFARNNNGCSSGFVHKANEGSQTAALCVRLAAAAWGFFQVVQPADDAGPPFCRRRSSGRSQGAENLRTSAGPAKALAVVLRRLQP